MPRPLTYSAKDQIAAIHALKRIGHQAEGAIPDLLQLVSEGQNEIRIASAEALGVVAPLTEKNEEVFNRLRTIEEELLTVKYTNQFLSMFAHHGRLVLAIEQSLDRIAEGIDASR